MKDRGRRGPRCRECHAAYVKPLRKLWYLRNREKKKAKSREWREKNKDKIPQKRAEYRKKAQETIRAKDRRYSRTRAHKKRAHAAAYRARKLQQTPQLTTEQRDEIYAIYGRAQELSKSTGEPHHVDHIIPLKHPQVCGLHTPCNLQVIPGRLNTRKRNCLLLDMLTYTILINEDAN